AVCGIIENILNIVILSYHGFQDTNNILLTSLSFDFFIGSLTEAFYRLTYIMLAYYPESRLFLLCRQYLLIWNGLSFSLSQLLAAVIAVERLAAVWFPFLVSLVFTPRRVMILIVLLHVITFLFFSPGFLTYLGIWENVHINNATFNILWVKGLSDANIHAIAVYLLLFGNTISSTVPLLIILVSSVLTVIKMHIITREMKILSPSAVRSKKLKILRATKMLLVVCFFSFLVCIVSFILDTSPLLFGLQKYFHVAHMEISHIFYQFDTVINFIIYVSMSSKFVNTYKKLFCTC
ncbi:unnamed protein product, partial [Lymnaea stagnalis]